MYEVWLFTGIWNRLKAFPTRAEAENWIARRVRWSFPNHPVKIKVIYD